MFMGELRYFYFESRNRACAFFARENDCKEAEGKAVLAALLQQVMLSVNAHELDAVQFGEPGYFPGFFRIDEFFADALSWLMDVFTDVVQDREGIEFFVVSPQEFDHFHHSLV
jgi:hypothetical protein